MSKELENHLSDMQTVALQMSLLAEALNSLIDYPEHRDIAATMVERIIQLADGLNNGLDSVSLGKIRGGAA
ncbi:hypothetical protein [Paenirhodobacter enshiensis]|uniref:hypothetical protein n=1 Tax=Paenirhodobacter enshiensis TaxID=1105367 RepID=UPI0035B3B2A2